MPFLLRGYYIQKLLVVFVAVDFQAIFCIMEI